MILNALAPGASDRLQAIYFLALLSRAMYLPNRYMAKTLQAIATHATFTDIIK
jgi:hypothetical protein